MTALISLPFPVPISEWVSSAEFHWSTPLVYSLPSAEGPRDRIVSQGNGPPIVILKSARKMGAGRKPGPQCSYNDPVNIDDGTMCRAQSPTPRALGSDPVLLAHHMLDAKSVSRMTHEQKIEEAFNRARESGQISKEVLNQLPSVKQFVMGIVVVGGVVAGLTVTAGAVASTGVGAVLEGIVGGIVLALSAAGVVTSVRQIAAGIKTLMRFYEGTRKARTPEDLDAAGKDLATGIAEAGVGTVMMILSVLGARQGLNMGKGAVGKWNAGRTVLEKPVTPKASPPEDPEQAVRRASQQPKGPTRPTSPSFVHGESDGGPGKWGPPSTPRNELGVEYQQQVTGAPPGTEYKVPSATRKSGYVDFDGYDPQRNVLVDAKDYSKWPPEEPEFLRERAVDDIVKQAGAQVRAANGTPIEWHVPTEAKADEIAGILMENNIRGIQVVATPKQ
jgi:Restriction endonuclease fold toxin 5